MSSTLDRVAYEVERIILRRLFENKVAGYSLEASKEIARAAIEELREPTGEQLNAARDWSHEKYGKPVGNDGATGCWQAMIDGALK